MGRRPVGARGVAELASGSAIGYNRPFPAGR